MACQADIKMMFDWKGLYIVDFSMYPHLIGVVIDYEDSEPGKPECPRLALKKRLLKEHGWDIVNLKYSDFQNDPKTVIKKVVDELNTVSCILTLEIQKSLEGEGNKR